LNFEFQVRNFWKIRHLDCRGGRHGGEAMSGDRAAGGTSWSEWFQVCYRRYTYLTGVCLLEPWEKRIVNTSVAATIAVIVFSTGYYAPTYLTSLTNTFVH